MRTAELLYQCLLDEFKTPDAALRQLCDRFVAECDLSETLERLRSRAYSREAPRTSGDIDVPPSNALFDDWIATSKEPAE